MQTPQQQVLAKCETVFAKAKELYGLDFSKVAIRFDLKGCAAGMAGGRRGIGCINWFMRFNRDMLTREAFDHVLNATVPHEIAHLVCFMNPKLGRGHDHGWTRVCRALGGNGERCHSEDVVFGKGKTYEYTSSTGHKLRLSQQRHNSIQRGQTYSFRSGKGTVSKACEYSIVGVQGRTLATPDVKPATRARIVEVVAAVAAVLPAGKMVGTDQYPAAFGKYHTDGKVINVPPSVLTELVTVAAVPGESKAATSRRIMLAGYQNRTPYETVIESMMTACGYSRQLARATYKANQAKAGIP